MRWMIAALGLGWGALAWAQDAAGLTRGDTVWVVEEIRSERFADAAVTGPVFRPGEPVTVLFVEAARLRVRKGDRYGWVPSTAVTSEDPAMTPSAAP